MAADAQKEKAPSDGTDAKYDVLMRDLQTVVERLEAGELPLEASLSAFEEGVRLVRRGEALLGAAEARIEQLLSEGGADRAVPFEAESQGQNGGTPRAAKGRGQARGRAEIEDEDVPF